MKDGRSWKRLNWPVDLVAQPAFPTEWRSVTACQAVATRQGPHPFFPLICSALKVRMDWYMYQRG